MAGYYGLKFKLITRNLQYTDNNNHRNSIFGGNTVGMMGGGNSGVTSGVTMTGTSSSTSNTQTKKSSPLLSIGTMNHLQVSILGTTNGKILTVV